MQPAEQGVLVQMPERPGVEGSTSPGGALKFRRVDRRQTVMRMLDVEALIGAEHKARAIWDLTGRLDLGRFTTSVKTREGRGGREA
jgi:hypothetical protein